MSSFTIGTVKIRVGADTTELSRGLEQAKSRLLRSGAQLQSIGANLTRSVSLPIAAFGVIALKAAGDIEALQKGLIAVTGSSEKAKIEFEKLREVAKLPGLGLEEAVRGSVALQAAGFSADEARASLLAFGNALATVGKGKTELNFVQLALTQLQNKTSGYGQEIRQLTEQLPQLRGALQNAFGTSESDKIAKLGITGKEVVQILTQEFAKLPKVAGGLKNSFENAGDAIKIALFNVGTSINKNFKIEELIDKIATKLIALSDAFGKLSPQAQKTILTIAGIAAALGPTIFVIGKIQSSIGIVTGLFAKMATGSLLSSSKIIFGLGPVSVALIGIGVAVAALIFYWDDLTASFESAKRESENFRNSMIFLNETLNGIIITGKFIIDIFADMFQSAFLFFQALSGEITFKEALARAKTEFYESGKEYGLEIAKGINDSNIKEKLSKLSELTGIQSPSGDRRNLYKGSSTSTNPTKVITATKVGTDKAELTALQELSKKFKEIDTLLKSGFITSLDSVNEKLSAVDSTASLLAGQGLKETSKEFQKLISIQNEVKKQQEISFVIKGDLNFPIDDIVIDVNKKLAEIDLSAAFGQNVNIAAEKIEVLKTGLQTLKTAGVDPADSAVVKMVKDLNALDGPKGFTLQTFFDIIGNAAQAAESKIKKALDGIDKNVKAANLAAAFGQEFSNISGNLGQSKIDQLEAQAQKEKAVVEKSVLNEKEKAARLLSIETKLATEKAKINKKAAIQNKALGIFNSLISTYEGVAKALATANIPLSIAIGALGLAQVAAIASQPLPSLAIGTNLVQNDGLANIHKGEAIVPAKIVEGGFKNFARQSERTIFEIIGKLTGPDLVFASQYSQPIANRLK